VKAGNRPLNEYERKPGDKPGVHCRVGKAPGRTIRHLLIDTNHWKTFLFSRLAQPLGAAGCLSLFGREPSRHRLFADHLKAEYCIKTFGRGREVIEWSVKPGRPDNHWFDCLTGATCAASLFGCGLTVMGAATDTRKRVSFAEMQARKK
jgi:hypothetical protein